MLAWLEHFRREGAVLTVEENVEPVEDSKAVSLAERIRRWNEDETTPCPFDESGKG